MKLLKDKEIEDYKKENKALKETKEESHKIIEALKKELSLWKKRGDGGVLTY